MLLFRPYHPKRLAVVALTRKGERRITTTLQVPGTTALGQSSSPSLSPNPPPICVMTARSPQSSRGGFVEISSHDGTTTTSTALPYLLHQQQATAAALNVVVAHGLGTDPPQKTHLNDIAHDLWRDCHAQLQNQPSSTTMTRGHSNNNKEGSVVYYTARGHGTSYGWDEAAKKVYAHNQDNKQPQKLSMESTDAKNLAEPFTWPALARDMAAVINQTLSAQHGDRNDDTSPPSITIFGQSMGAATAVYYAMMPKEETTARRQINALILARPPRIWQARQSVAQDYVQAAKEYQQTHPQHPFHFLPILAASMTDLPLPNDSRWTSLSGGSNNNDDDQKPIPTLILCHGNDEAHPLASGRLLKEHVLPHATLSDIAANEDEARKMWPVIMANWLAEQGLVNVERVTKEP